MKDPKQQAIANLRFIRAIKRAKAEDVDVIGILGEVEDQERLSKTRNFLLVFAGIWCFVGPIACVWAQIYVEEHSLTTVRIPADLQYWLCAMGFISILAFGFDLVNPRTLFKIGLRKDGSDSEYTLSKSGRFTPLHGDEIYDEY